MLRGQHRYQYVESTAAYHQIANPLIEPIRGVSMGLPKAVEKSREFAQQQGPLLRNMHPVVPDNGYYNFVAAFRKRCNYYSGNRATPDIVAAAMELCDELFPERMAPFDWTDSLYKSWLSKFGPEKQNRMNEALRKLSDSNVSDYTTKDVFVKVEALLVTHKPNWAPRIIYKGTDVYNAVSGPIFNELMRRLDHALERQTGDFQYKTSYRKTPCEYTPFIESDHEEDFFVEADFSSNDKLQCADVQLLELAFMRAQGCPEWFIRLHAKTDEYRVVNRAHRVKATLKHQFATGSTDTTYRNCLWNIIISRAVCNRLRKNPANQLKSVRALVLGDDFLAKFNGRVKYLEKVYSSVAADACMEAKVKRHAVLCNGTFLSRFFLPSDKYGKHFTVPILGKSLGRFNMRANANKAVSDHCYMAGKSVSYAYEFRYFPTLRNIFLERFKYHAAFLDSMKEMDKAEDLIGWNSRAAGVTLSNIVKKLVVKEYLDDADFTRFCLHRYGVLGSDVLDLFRDVVLTTDKLDMEGTVVNLLACDFRSD